MTRHTQSKTTARSSPTDLTLGTHSKPKFQGDRSDEAFLKFNVRIVFALSLLAGGLATWWSYAHHVILAYGDAEAHLNIAKRVVDGLTPGFAQLGGIWLPLPHLLMVPFVAFNPLWRSGIGGSIVSVAALIWLCIIVYKLAYELTHSFAASYIAPLIILINPNSLYLATTPMTELLLLSMFASSVFYFIRWLRTDKLPDLIFAALFTGLATISRYDGWALAVVEAVLLIVYLVSRRSTYKAVEGIVYMYSFLAFIGIALWLLWNKLIFGTFFYFANSVYGSKVQQQYFLKNGYLPTYHNLSKSIIYFLEDIRLVIGLPVIAISLAGLVVFTVHMWRRKNKKLLALIVLTLTPILFYVVSLYIGQASLILPEFAKAGAIYTLSNVRYGIQILLFIAIFAAYLGGKYRKLIPFILLIAIAQTVAFIKTDNVITYNDGTRGLSSQVISKGPDAPAVEAYMRTHYDKGLVLMDDYRRPIGLVESGVPMNAFIGSGNKPYWNESFDDPGKFATWIIVQKSDTDAVWTGIKRKSLIDSEFDLVYNKGNLFVYKKKTTAPDVVIQVGQHLSLNGKPFVISGVDSYDLLIQPNATITSRLQAVKAAKLNTVRLWCFGKDGVLSSANFAQLDYVMQQAAEMNLKVICVFGNTYNDYGGPNDFYANGSAEQFFTSQKSMSAYEAQISSVMNHTSALSGLVMKKDPTILAWELINEPRIETTVNSSELTRWTNTIGKYVNGIDQEHLISPGTEGFTNSYPGQAYNESHGSSIEQLCNLEVITLCSGHLYLKYVPVTATNQINYSAINTIAHTWRSVADSEDKPFYVGEVGYDLSTGSVSSREAYYSTVAAILHSNQLDGSLIWNLGTTTDSTFTLGTTDPVTATILSNWANAN